MILREHMGKRQEHKADFIGLEHQTDRVDGLPHVDAKVPMGEDAALWPAGRTGCVDYRGDIGGLEGVDALVDDGIGHGFPTAGKVIQCPVVNDEDLRTPLLPARGLAVQGLHRRRLDHEHLDITIMDDPLHLVSRRRFVDRNCHTAAGEDGIVGSSHSSLVRDIRATRPPGSSPLATMPLAMARQRS